MTRILDMARPARLLRIVPPGGGARLLAAATAALAASMVWSGAEATETHIEHFVFGCETSDGRIVKPRHGDIEGVIYTALPAQRQQCLGTIDRKIALCRENTDFLSETDNRAFPDCLPLFEEQARACVVHFSYERGKCGTDGTGPDDPVAGEQGEQPAQEGPPADRYRIEQADRLMRASEAANLRTGPSPDYDIVGTVRAGDELRVTGEVRGRDWLRVSFRGGTAFVYAPLLRPTRQEAVQETVQEDDAAPRPADSPPRAGADWSIAENQPCQVWNYGNRDYEPFTWTGACVEGKASGEGRLVYRGGEGVYEGGMEAGKMHGRGILTWANGFRYEGELRDGKQHGYGTFTEASGERYEGNWRDGKPHGQGTYVQGDGTTFKGEWRDGCFGTQGGRWASIGTSAAACGFE